MNQYHSQQFNYDHSNTLIVENGYRSFTLFDHSVSDKDNVGHKEFEENNRYKSEGSKDFEKICSFKRYVAECRERISLESTLICGHSHLVATLRHLCAPSSYTNPLLLFFPTNIRPSNCNIFYTNS